MRSLRFVLVGGTLSFRALFNRTSPPMFVGSLMSAPVFQMLFFVALGRHTGVADDKFFVIGNVLLATTGAGVIGGTMAIANEREYSTLGAVLLSPRSRVQIWGGRALPYIATALFSTIFTFSIGSLLLGRIIPASGLAALLLTLLTAAISATALGMVVGSIGLRVTNNVFVANVAYTLLILLTGTNVPRDILPSFLQTVGSFIPLTHATEAARSIARSDFSLSLVGQELVVGVCYGAAAIVLLRYFEHAARKRASFDTQA
ncbi:ABC transporter permease [Streptomyces sp. NBC_00012]|uniref:ABC transporter permease n=1 Tax=unclassified Streptomyces TaxID=2593676 RepID=UPI003246CC6A